jgi:hypothetical protein
MDGIIRPADYEDDPDDGEDERTVPCPSCRREILGDSPSCPSCERYALPETIQKRSLVRESCTMQILGPFRMALTHGGLRNYAEALGPRSALWLAHICPASERPRAMGWRPRVCRLRRLRLGRLRLVAIRVRERGLLRRIYTCRLCVSHGCETGLRRKAGHLRPHCPCLRSAASRSCSVESGVPSRLAKGLVSDTPCPAKPYGGWNGIRLQCDRG